MKMPRGYVSEVDKAILSRMRDERELLSEFGAQLHGSDPGVTAYLKNDTGRISGQGAGMFGESLSFTAAEWKWLRPLLEELRSHRRCVKFPPPVEIPGPPTPRYRKKGAP